VDEATITRLHGDLPLTEDHPSVAKAIEVQERHTPWLLAKLGVVGTGVGLNDAGQVALIVYTKADVRDIPLIIEGLPVEVWKSGEFFSLNRLTKQDGNAVATRPVTASDVDTTQHFSRPVPIGVSTGHPLITAGTIGARVKKNEDVYALSNNHVYANSNNAALGDNVLQPGDFDGGVDPDDAIGTLAAFVLIQFGTGSNYSSYPSNSVDAAIALTQGTLDNTTPGDGYGIPRSSTASPKLGLKVRKYGRTTGQTDGTVNAVNLTVIVNYGTPANPIYAKFVGQIQIGSSGFSAGGDSGSLIVARGGSNDKKPVGLLFAGSSSSTIGNKISSVLSAFGVTVDGPQ
jgi:hypothetical protein